jgi:hypothetical protein
MPDSNENHTGGRLVIYRPIGSPVTVSEANVTATVQDGAIVVTGKETFYIFSPGQWVSVNSDPNN